MPNKLIISHPEKILFPKAKVTKGEVVAYYTFIADRMLPYLKDRPLSLKQYPHGITQEGFFHKHAANFYPSYIQRLMFPSAHQGDIEMIGVKSAEGLAYLAGQNTIEIHTGLATVKNFNKPDQIILDFDPSDNDFEKVRTVTLIAKDILDQNDLTTFVKTTGSRGLHVHIPLKPKQDFHAIKALAKQLSEHIASKCPDLATTEFRKNKRSNKVFIDWLRNDHTATAISVYSLRANEYAGIATPVTWDEVQHDKKLLPYSFTIKNIQQRLNNVADPWQDFK